MKVTVTTWEYADDGDTLKAEQSTFESPREFEEAGHDRKVWKSFKRGMADKWNEDGIFKIPDWLAEENNFPHLRGGNSYHSDPDWTDFAAIEVVDETDKAFQVGEVRASKTGFLWGTNGLRSSHAKGGYIPKSQIVRYELTESTMSDDQCWNCGNPLIGMYYSVMDDEPTLKFEYDGEERHEHLCPDCADDLTDVNENSAELYGCKECGKFNLSCRPRVGGEWKCDECASRPVVPKPLS